MFKRLFLFVGDLNAHHEEWQSPVTNQHGRKAMDFTISSGCTQIVNELTDQDDGVLDLVITDVPDIVNVEVRAPIIIGTYIGPQFIVCYCVGFTECP